MNTQFTYWTEIERNSERAHFSILNETTTQFPKYNACVCVVSYDLCHTKRANFWAAGKCASPFSTSSFLVVLFVFSLVSFMQLFLSVVLTFALSISRSHMNNVWIAYVHTWYLCVDINSVDMKWRAFNTHTQNELVFVLFYPIRLKRFRIRLCVSRGR